MSNAPVRSLARLLRPKSIAVIGGAEAAQSIRQSRLLGFEGDIWAVNPRRDQLEDVPCHPTIEDLPRPPDAAFVAVPREATIEAVTVLSRQGAGGAICYASGFAETGDGGEDFQHQLLAAAGDMPIIGPNCYGMINYLDGAALWPDLQGQQRIKRGVAVISQSGNIGINVAFQNRALPLAQLITVGNQAMIGVEDCIDDLLEDPRISAIGLIIEGVRDPVRFSQAAIRALAKGVPLVALKIGRGEETARVALSHTGTLTGRDDLYDALFARFGVARVESLTGLLETLKCLAIIGPLPGRRLASLSCSGGEAGMMADAIASRRLEFPAMDRTHQAAVRETLSELVTVNNPLDYHTFIWGDEPALRRCFTTMLRGGYDAAALVFDFPSTDLAGAADWLAAPRAFAEAARVTGTRGVLISNLPENQPDWGAAMMVEAGVAPLQGLSEAVAVLEAAADIGAAQSLARTEFPLPLTSTGVLSKGPEKVLDEWTSKQLLAKAGMTVPESRVCSIDQAPAAAREIGYPVCVKVLADGIGHKSDVGGVFLNLGDDAALRDALEKLARLGDRVLVEAMVSNSVGELIIGASRDPQFGTHLVIGAGGVLVELLEDAVPLLLPCRRGEIERAVRSLRAIKLLEGWRGKPPGDIDAVVTAIEQIAQFVLDKGDRLIEMDINPLMVRPTGQGAVVADALIRMGEESENE